ncbi:flagellar motor stator protein MotA [Moellerella wisconsensis]|uniref:MotA family flagellar motor rotation protein n=1 Tax=Moellerella wisconsensis ATCC 35017 TaxID=1354267 RepID=A0A0N1KHX3_9GAMM|nr:flagellar motor stator protein MotA [Moellerella wisconsensis]KPD02348.1 MotA family flagellar motor rotation protein [Moellerella wisconsensis ATCC 35017]VFS54010.1 Chemotaxis protein MotA [Moellerella wisconsensis]
MFVFLGYLCVVGAVIGGYTLVGGHLAALYQPAEFLIILGAGIGGFLVANNGRAIKATVKILPKLIANSNYNKALYMDLMALQFRVMTKVRISGAISLEKEIDDPKNSEIFSHYPRLLNDQNLMTFLLDYLRLIVTGNMNVHEIEALMDEEIDTFERESDIPATSLAMLGDSLPAFGIVAAVMGVVHALGSADQSAVELGILIGNAMVGTFVGILLAYGFVSPLSNLVRQKSHLQIKMMECIKVTLLSYLSGYAPQIAVEFGRKTLFSDDRPSFSELEEHVRKVKVSSSANNS